tara:strand:+ start:325 stop:789 length:465 start_codon:yes stop_codon:yes gene_type:complete
MIKINVIISNTKWCRYIKIPSNYIDRKITKLNRLNKKFKKKILFLTILLSCNKEIKLLNKKFRNKNKTTDILSFPFYNKKDLKINLKKEKEIYLGDIIINLDKVKFKKNLTSFKFEFDKLWIHGLTHLFGHDHKRERDFKKMNKEEKNYLKYIK